MTRKIRKPLQQISIIVTLSFVSSNTLKFLFEQNPTFEAKHIFLHPEQRKMFSTDRRLIK